MPPSDMNLSGIDHQKSGDRLWKPTSRRLGIPLTVITTGIKYGLTSEAIIVYATQGLRESGPEIVLDCSVVRAQHVARF